MDVSPLFAIRGDLCAPQGRYITLRLEMKFHPRRGYLLAEKLDLWRRAVDPKRSAYQFSLTSVVGRVRFLVGCDQPGRILALRQRIDIQGVIHVAQFVFEQMPLRLVPGFQVKRVNQLVSVGIIGLPAQDDWRLGARITSRTRRGETRRADYLHCNAALRRRRSRCRPRG